MASSFDVSDCARQISEHAYALWIEAAMLTPLAKEHPRVGLRPIVLLVNKSAEVCRLAQMIDKMVSGGHATLKRPSIPEPLIQKGRRGKRGRA